MSKDANAVGAKVHSADRVLRDIQFEGEASVVTELGHTPLPADRGSKLAWLATVASFISIIVGAALIASGIIGDERPVEITPAQETDVVEGAPDDLFFFAGTSAQRWQVLETEPSTFMVETSVGLTAFSILFSPDQGNDIAMLGDLTAPSASCNASNQCEVSEGDIVADRISRVSSVVDEVRLVERTTADGQPQTTATFIWEGNEVVRVVGDCSSACVRNALAQLRVGDESDIAVAVVDRSPAPGRILVGVFFLYVGALTRWRARKIRALKNHQIKPIGLMAIVGQHERDEINRRQTKGWLSPPDDS